MNDQLNFINSTESPKHLSKTKKFIENTKKAVRKALTTTGIVTSTMGPMATTTTTTFIPASVNTISAIAPTASTVAKAISLGTAASLLSACSDKDGPDDPINVKDTTPPTINISKSEVDITGGKEVRISGNQLYIGSDLVASRKDNVSKNCKVILSYNGKAIESGNILKGSGTLNIQVIDEAGNKKDSSIKLNTSNESNAPEITIHKEEIDISKGKKVSIQGNQLLIGEETVVSRKDDSSENCSVNLKFNDKDIEPDTVLNTAGTLNITVTDGEGKSSSVNVKLIISNGAPEISIIKPEVDVSKGKKIDIKGNQLFLGDEAIVSRKDDNTQDCEIKLTFNDKEIATGTTLKDEGVLGITVTDKDGKSSSANIKLNITNEAPGINVKYSEVNIFGGVKVVISNNQLLFGDEVIASRSDDRTENCKVSLKLNGTEISSGTTINNPGTLILTITDGDGAYKSAEIILKNESIYGLENLKNASIQVDKEINILNGITFANGVELIKIEVETDGSRNTISDPHHYTPSYPGTMTVIFTIKGKNGNTAEVNVDNLTIKPLDYRAVEVKNIKPVDILPIIGQVEVGDKNVYNHIEHLRIAEATRIRDMMREYGAGNYSAEEYQKLMMRLNTGMIQEYPKGYNNFEFIGTGTDGNGGTNHSHIERSILNTLLNHANLKCVLSTLNEVCWDKVETFINGNQNTITILGCSSYIEDTNKENFQRWSENSKIRELCKSKKLIIFKSGGNIYEEYGILKNKSYQRDINGDEHGIYSLQANANGKNDSDSDIALLVTVGTNKDGDINQTNEVGESSLFPVGFHNKVLFSGRAFPYHSLNSGKIGAESRKYATSFTNYVNVAITDLCFQMKADVANTDELLENIRSTTLTDYIRFDLNGDGDTNDKSEEYQNQPETQPLQLINPAGYTKKYLMPNDLPSSIQTSKTITINKGFYKGVIIDMPGAEVNINGQWIAWNDVNKSQIKSQNPMTLKWRINGDLCKKLGYKGKTINGKIIVVDDKRNGLNITKDFSISIL